MFRGQAAYTVPGYTESNPFPSIEEMVSWISSSILKAYTERSTKNSSTIANEYINEFNGYLSNPVAEFSFDQQATIGAQISGDYHFIIPALEEAQKYAQAGKLILTF